MSGRNSGINQNQKREQAQNAELSTKRQKLEVVAEPNESEAGKRMKINGLNADCLEHIFKQLELKDLLNVADSKKSFREGVEQAFISKYGQRDVWIDGSNLEIEESGKEIKIHNFVTGLKFLRCFGKLTTSLMFDYDHFELERRFLLDHYTSNYCTETLRDLTFFDAPLGAIAGLEQPFTNLEKLCVYDELGLKLSDFDKWFPNLQYLKLLRIRSVTDSKCIAVRLPHLNHLEIDDANFMFQSENFSNCFRLNPQLQTLRISRTNDCPSILKSASELLPHLENLYIRPRENDFVNMKKVIHFKNVKKFELNYAQRPLSKLPLSFEQLEEFSMKVSRLPTSGIIQEFIGMHPSVKKVDIAFIIINIAEDSKMKLMKTWSFGDKFRASFKFGEYFHKMKFERIN